MAYALLPDDFHQIQTAMSVHNLDMYCRLSCSLTLAHLSAAVLLNDNMGIQTYAVF